MAESAPAHATWLPLFEEAGSDASSGNRLTLLANGDKAFRSIWNDIDAATQRVWIEVYTFEGDGVGRRMRQALVDAARRGCDVVVLYDSFGSADTPGAFFAPLKDAGGTVVPYNVLSPWQQWRRRAKDPLHRDHRKIAVIDDHIAYSGGANISEKYAGPELGTDYFYDTLLRVEGPAAARLAGLFLNTLQASSNIQREVPTDASPATEGSPVRIISLDRWTSSLPGSRTWPHRALPNGMSTATCYEPARKSTR